MEVTAKLEILHQDVSDIKDVLRELTVAINRLALVEERLANTGKALERAFGILEDISKRLSVLEQQAPLNKQTNSWVNKAVTYLVGALIGYVLASTIHIRGLNG